MANAKNTTIEKTPQGFLLAKRHIIDAALAGGIGWGMLGGLAGTMLMDLMLIGAFMIAGLPAFTCFSLVGETVEHLFTLLGVEMTGGVLLGVSVHYLIGPLIGAIFGAVVARFPALRTGTLKKCLILAVLYVEVLSQPLLALAPLLLKMTQTEILEWYGGSFVMHFILGIILGTVVSHGLRLASAASHK